MRTIFMLLVACVVLGSGCSKPTANEKQVKKTAPTSSEKQIKKTGHPVEVSWATTSGHIINIQRLPDGKYCYSLEYTAAQSTAVNLDGEPIKGPIQQHYLGKEKKPIHGQEIKMRYMVDEPIIYNLLEPIKYVE